MIAVVAAIALLFVLGVSCGAIQGEGSGLGDLDAGWVRTLNDLIGRKPAVAIGDLSSRQAACVQGDRLAIAPAGACGYVIQASNRAVRKLSLQLRTGSSAVVAVQQGDFSENTTLTPGSRSASFDILPDDAATLTITCAAGPACTVSVEE